MYKQGRDNETRVFSIRSLRSFDNLLFRFNVSLPLVTGELLQNTVDVNNVFRGSSPVTKGSETLNLNNKLSKERSDLIEISLHSTYEECLLYETRVSDYVTTPLD